MNCSLPSDREPAREGDAFIVIGGGVRGSWGKGETYREAERNYLRASGDSRSTLRDKLARNEVGIYSVHPETALNAPGNGHCLFWVPVTDHLPIRIDR